jgi:tRNA (guanosine-2'-O-)-methyltransferase
MPKSPEFEKQLCIWGSQKIIERLSPYLTIERKEKIIPVVDQRIKSIQAAVEDPLDIHNALAIVRTAEALGLTDAHLIGQPNKGKGRQTMRGADRWMNLHSYESFPDFAYKQKCLGFRVYGATPEAALNLDQVPLDVPCCFLFGNEKKGLSREALDACDLHYRIPMHGFCESFNVSVAAAISLYDAVRRKRRQLLDLGDLSEQEKLCEIAWFYYKSAGARIAAQVFSE